MDTDLFRGPNKRPRPTSMGNAVLPSLKRAKGSATHTPQSPASTAVPGDIEAGPSTQPWYRNPKRKAHARAPHGYQLKELMVQRDGAIRLCESVAFWPYVSPDDLEMAGSKWDEMEGVFAYASSPIVEDDLGGKVMVARLSDEHGLQELWSYEFPLDRIYNVAWSYDPITLRPILAVGGQDKLIYIMDHQQRGIMRNKILRGHGEPIFAIVFHPNMPHIFASASADGTIRIWNLYGQDLDPDQPGPSSQNYPMGDADEGSHCIAILAGWRYGHDAEVGALGFHPQHAAIASGGLDRQVKIWILPPLPLPGPATGPARQGYRPIQLSQPAFSTGDLHKFAIDCIDWLGNDILLSRAGDETIIWKWLGYDRYFNPAEFEPIARRVIRPDSKDSRSFAIIRAVDTRLKESNVKKYKIEATWYWRYGLHHAFDPSDDEVDFATVDLVTDTLIVYPASAKPPRLNILNAHIWEPTPPEDELDDDSHEGEYRREHTPNIYGEQEKMPVELGWHESMPIRVDLEVEEGGTRSTVPPGDRAPPPTISPSHITHPRPSDAQTTGSSTERRSERPALLENDLGNHQPPLRPSNTILPTPSTLPAHTPSDQASTPLPGSEDIGRQAIWSLALRPKDIENCLKKSKLSPLQKAGLKRHDPLLQAVAISPRGAKWIVGVGMGEALAIWKLRDKPDS